MAENFVGISVTIHVKILSRSDGYGHMEVHGSQHEAAIIQRRLN